LKSVEKNGAHSCLTNSSLVRHNVFQQNGTTRMTTAKQYDYLNRLGSGKRQASVSSEDGHRHFAVGSLSYDNLFPMSIF
jgi:hypothetical protein